MEEDLLPDSQSTEILIQGTTNFYTVKAVSLEDIIIIYKEYANDYTGLRRFCGNDNNR
jgi:hypothetical protein